MIAKVLYVFSKSISFPSMAFVESDKIRFVALFYEHGKAGI